MFWKTAHDFLKWMWPALGGAAFALVGVAVAASAIWEGAKSWTSSAFAYWCVMLSTPLPYIVVTLIFVVWLWAFLYSGRMASSMEAKPALEQPQASISQHHAGFGDNVVNTVNLGPQRRNLNSPDMMRVRNGILELDRTEPWELFSTMGDTEADRLACQIYDFMVANGFPLTPANQSCGLMNRPLDLGITVNTENRTIYVGPSH